MKAPSPELIDRIGIEKLASIPEVTVRLMQTCNDPEADFDDLTAIIRRDAGLTSKILHVANSPLYAQWGEINDLNRMLVVLGVNTIRAIAVTSGVLELFAHIAPRRKSLLSGFWYRSLLCAQLARSLAESSAYRCPEEAYLGGLLHKVGQIVLMNAEPAAYEQMLTNTSDAADLYVREEKRFGISHVELSAWLVERWGLGILLGDALRYQAEPTDRLLDAPPLVKLVNLSARLAEPVTRPFAVAGVDKLLLTTTEDLERLLDQAEQTVVQVARTFGVAIEEPERGNLAESGTAPPFPPERAELAGLVRNAALLESVKAAMWSHSATDGYYPAIQTFFTVLFGLESSGLFLQVGNGRLQGVPAGEGDRWLDTMVVKLEPGRSILCDAVLGGTRLDSFRYLDLVTTLTVFDRQLIRRCGRKGLLGIPLVAGERTVGILVAGIDPPTLEALAPHSELLGFFAQEAANLILHQRNEQEQRRLLVAETRAEVAFNARKIRQETNNPLSIVNNYLHILGAKLGEDHKIQSELDVIKGEIERVSCTLLGLTERLTQEGTAPGVVDLNRLVSTLCSVLQPTLFDPRDIQVRLDLDRTVESIESDRDRLKQILMNLLMNAAEAVPDGGRIDVHTRGNILNDQGRWVEIGIRDNGPGLPDSIQLGLFSTGIRSEGHQYGGNGLSAIARITRELGGLIQCRTDAKGTEFLISLPVAKLR